MKVRAAQTQPVSQGSLPLLTAGEDDVPGPLPAPVPDAFVRTVLPGGITAPSLSQVVTHPIVSANNVVQQAITKDQIEDRPRKLPAGPAAKKSQPSTPPQIERLPYTGGAPALRPDQMSEAVIKNNLILRILYALPKRAQFMTTGYMGLTKVFGPIGAAAFFGYNIRNTMTFMKDPKSPVLLKAGVAGATVLSGLSAAGAVRLGAAALHLAPMTDAAMQSMGKFAGVTGCGAGALIAAMDTFNTFRDPNSTPAQKGFSTLTTASAVGIGLAMALGLTGPIGLGLGIASFVFPLAKGLLGKNQIANAVFGAVGQALSPVAKLASGAVHGLAHVFSSL